MRLGVRGVTQKNGLTWFWLTCQNGVPINRTHTIFNIPGKSELTKLEVSTAISAAEGPYKELLKYYNEIVSMHKHVMAQNGAKSSHEFLKE